jgi:hypothetical protein
MGSIKNFELERREDAKGRKKLVYVKIKEKQSSRPRKR